MVTVKENSVIIRWIGLQNYFYLNFPISLLRNQGLSVLTGFTLELECAAISMGCESRENKIKAQIQLEDPRLFLKASDAPEQTKAHKE